MEHLDREAMEFLGYFFLPIGLVPKSWADSQLDVTKVEPEDSRGPIAVWWRYHECNLDVRGYCDKKWARTDPTGWYLCDDVEESSWSDENNHRVEIVEDEDDWGRPSRDLNLAEFGNSDENTRSLKRSAVP